MTPHSAARLNRSSIVRFRRRLLGWYGQHKRDLPWRRTRDPYAITVAELMLQQTQVDRVIPKFEQWMRRFPTVQTLARAKKPAVIAAWQGLGYNRRALYVHTLAKTIVQNHNGRFPRQRAALEQLPGIGPYTAGAISCFAFGDSSPLVDTNVRRVLGRVFFGFQKLPDLPDDLLWAASKKVVPRNRTAAYNVNQGLMDLGQRICTTRKPGCNDCPLQSVCMSYPAITSARPDQLRAKKKTAEPQFFGQPRRIWRGKILAFLHTTPSATAGQIGRAIQPDFNHERLPWLYDTLQTLSADGLVEQTNQRFAIATT